MKEYKVWIDVEEIDEENDSYINLDLNFSSCRTFDNEADAIAFAGMLSRIAENIEGA
jgi:hypothetical protein